MSQPFIICVILNTNRRADTLECLASLYKSSYPAFKVIVLDNHSTDGSVTAICEAFPETQILELEGNLGYAGNNNVGIEAAIRQGADWVYVLNEDTISDPDCLDELVRAGESDPKIGIVGPMVYHHNEPTTIQSAGGMLGKYWQSQHLYENELDQGQFQSMHPVMWISGCAMLVRKAVIEQVGLLDTNFFIYWDETEWCIRALEHGWQIFHVPEAKIWHKGVQRNYQPKPSFTYYSTRNHLLMLEKHNAPLRVKLYTWVQIFRTLASWTIKPKWRYKREHRNAMWRGLLDFVLHHWGPMP
jgi:GT2 family glycosyltransferase